MEMRFRGVLFKTVDQLFHYVDFEEKLEVQKSVYLALLIFNTNTAGIPKLKVVQL